jgi:hypothetical protein
MVSGTGTNTSSSYSSGMITIHADAFNDEEIEAPQPYGYPITAKKKPLS